MHRNGAARSDPFAATAALLTAARIVGAALNI